MTRARHRWIPALVGAGLMVGTAACGGDDEPGAAVRVRAAGGSTSATVDALPVTSSAAATATEPAPDVTSSVVSSHGSDSTLQVSEIIVLEPDGLGIVSFGDDADDAIAAVTAVLGEPSEDSGWVEPLTISTCAGSEARAVAWGSLYLYFSDESSRATGSRHLIGYSYGSVSELGGPPQGLSTPEGIGLGTTVEFLRAAYDAVVVEAGEEGLVEPNFYVDESLSGRLTGGEDDDLVTVIIGGDPCGVG